jgi:GntR family transcriptional regulator
LFEHSFGEDSMTVLHDDSPVPLYLQIEEELRGMIQAGELGPLARVPSENALSERFGVSRMTARKAIDRLVAEDVMFRRPGKGTFVGQPKIAHDPSQLLSFSAAMNAQGVHHSTRVLEAGTGPAPSNIARDLRLSPGSRVILVRRLRLIDDQPVAIHTSFIPARFVAILQGDLTGSLNQLMTSAGARVTSTNDSVECVLAVGEIARRLHVRAGSPLVFISGIAYSREMEALRHSEALYRGDRFRFRVDTTGGADMAARPDLRMEHKERSDTSG